MPPGAEWERCWELFVKAVNAKHAISVPEVLKTPTENNPRKTALLNNLNEQTTERKVLCRQKEFQRQIPIHDRIQSHIIRSQ